MFWFSFSKLRVFSCEPCEALYPPLYNARILICKKFHNAMDLILVVLRSSWNSRTSMLPSKNCSFYSLKTCLSTKIQKMSVSVVVFLLSSKHGGNFCTREPAFSASEISASCLGWGSTSVILPNCTKIKHVLVFILYEI